MEDKDIIIGITGTLGAGKGTIVEYLIKQKNFKHYSARGFINEEIVRRGLEINRDNMVLVANDLRAKHGSSYIAESLYQRAQADGGSCVIESLRTPGEIEALRSKGDFYMLAVDADVKERFNRIHQRNDAQSDNVTFEKFVAQEKREMTSTDPHKQNLSKCIEMSDYKFDNSGSKEDLYRQVDEVLAKIYS